MSPARLGAFLPVRAEEMRHVPAAAAARPALLPHVSHRDRRRGRRSWVVAVVAQVLAVGCGRRLLLEVVGAQRERSSARSPAPGEEEVALAPTRMPALGREEERHGWLVAAEAHGRRCGLGAPSSVAGGSGSGLRPLLLLCACFRLSVPPCLGRALPSPGLPALREEDSALAVVAGDERPEVVAEGVLTAALSLQVQGVLDEGKTGVVQAQGVLGQEGHEQQVVVANVVVHLLGAPLASAGRVERRCGTEWALRPRVKLGVPVLCAS